MQSSEGFKSSSFLRTDKDGDIVGTDVQIAVAAVLSGIAHVDGDYHMREYDEIISAVAGQFFLSNKECAHLRDVTEVLIKDRSKIGDYIDLINEKYSTVQKEKILDLACKISRADGKIEEEEEQYLQHLRGALQLEEASAA